MFIITGVPTCQIKFQYTYVITNKTYMDIIRNFKQDKKLAIMLGIPTDNELNFLDFSQIQEIEPSNGNGVIYINTYGRILKQNKLHT